MGQSGPYWSFSRNMSLGFLLAMGVYVVASINYLNNMSHTIERLVDELEEHEKIAAHGMVLPRLTGLEIRIGQLEAWQALTNSNRFTSRDARHLEKRIKQLEERQKQ